MHHIMDISSGLLVIILLSAVAWMYRRFTAKSQNLPPGPSGWPLLGVLPYFGRQNPQALIKAWSDQYGDIMSFRLGMQTVVILNDLTLIKEAFQHPDLNDRPQSLLLKECMGVYNTGLVFSNGQTWKEHRQFVHKVFRSLGVGKRTYEETIAAEVSHLLAITEEERGAAFDPHQLIGNAVFNIICSITLGTQYTYSDPDFVNIHRVMDENMSLSRPGGILFFIPIPGLSKLPFGRFRRFVDNIAATNKYFLEKIENHKMVFDPSYPRDFIDMYLKQLSEATNEKSTFNEINLLTSILDLIFAGTETTTSILRWSVMYMMENPDIQSRVQEELDHVVGRNRLPKLADRPNLPYTEAMLLECHRLSDVTPLGVAHVAAEETLLLGYTIPKGSQVISNLTKIAHDPKLWKDPLKFDPERYLNDDGKLIRPDELIPFSTGRRSCLGERLARMEFFLFFTGLLHRFTFKKPIDSPPLSFEGVIGITRAPRPFKTCAVKRDAW